MSPSDEYAPSTYGDRIAEYYDDWVASATSGPIESILGILRDLAGDGPVLELGIGTGRVALPLAESGLEVHGIDASERMIDELRRKPGGETIPIVLGDFSEFTMAMNFSLVFVVFNTFFGLTKEEEQQSCLHSVANCLEPGGRFLLELFVPDLTLFERGQRINVRRVETDLVHIDAAVVDEASQSVKAQHIVISGQGINLYPVQIRFAWPDQLDHMAAAAGLVLDNRWSSWNRDPFDASSKAHISVYMKV